MTRRNRPADPADERTSDQSTQSAGGLTAGRPGPDDPVRDREDNDLNARRRAARETPRRYDADADDTAMRADDAALKTKTDAQNR